MYMLITLDHVMNTHPLHMEATYLAQDSGFYTIPQMINFQFLQPSTESDPLHLIAFCK